MKLACENFSRIVALIKNGTFEELLAFHQRIYSLDSNLQKPKRLQKINYADHTSIHYFKQDKSAFCLPPKAGCTNWLQTLDKKYPSKINSTLIYRRLPSLKQKEIKRLKIEGKRVLNTRNPLTRAFSAWKDKYRFQVKTTSLTVYYYGFSNQTLISKMVE